MAVERSQLRPQPAQVEDAIDPAQQMIARNPLLKVELLEQAILPPEPLTQHRKTSVPITSGPRNHDPVHLSKEFFNSLGQKRTCRQQASMSALWP